MYQRKLFPPFFLRDFCSFGMTFTLHMGVHQNSSHHSAACTSHLLPELDWSSCVDVFWDGNSSSPHQPSLGFSLSFQHFPFFLLALVLAYLYHFSSPPPSLSSGPSGWVVLSWLLSVSHSSFQNLDIYLVMKLLSFLCTLVANPFWVLLPHIFSAFLDLFLGLGSFWAVGPAPVQTNLTCFVPMTLIPLELRSYLKS